MGTILGTIGFILKLRDVKICSKLFSKIIEQKLKNGLEFLKLTNCRLKSIFNVNFSRFFQIIFEQKMMSRFLHP